MQHAMRWSLALLTYASEHQGQFPSNFEQALPFLDADGISPEERAQTTQAADQYEILYTGRSADMTNPPPEAAIILRTKQPWQTSKGTWARAYIFGNGLGMIHTAPDGNFESWENIRMPKMVRN